MLRGTGIQQTIEAIEEGIRQRFVEIVEEVRRVRAAWDVKACEVCDAQARENIRSPDATAGSILVLVAGAVRTDFARVEEDVGNSESGARTLNWNRSRSRRIRRAAPVMIAMTSVVCVR